MEENGAKARESVLHKARSVWAMLSDNERVGIFAVVAIVLGAFVGFYYMDGKLEEQMAARQAAEASLQTELKRPVPEDSRIASLKDQLRIAQKTAEEERHEAYKQERKLRDRNIAILIQARAGFEFLRTLTNPPDVAGHILAVLRPVAKESGMNDPGNRGMLYGAYGAVLEEMGARLGVDMFSRQVLNAVNGLLLGGDAFLMRTLWGDSLVRSAVMRTVEGHKPVLVIFAKYPELLSVSLSDVDASEWDSFIYGDTDEENQKLLSLLGIDTARGVTKIDMSEFRFYLRFFYRRTLDSSPAAVDNLRKILAEIVGELFPAKKVVVAPADSKPAVAAAPEPAKSDVAKLVPTTTDAPVVDCRWDQFRIGNACVDANAKK